ncbi:MAG TPA: 1-(5-phosphoribosyl)-5-[(5-phosphoribosylamino)methylideneamino] imidazole-4-carboxamide isomerase [Holophagaceae bacterium]|nr:1-(5-phosphoribosyl)-5-[(5-phosphoribosylamino)methylideneamino] imidazole-4-carboxamide isomerase [Holophagaceae bacterium]
MTVQLIPSMDLMDGRVVRLQKGDRAQATFYDLAPEAWMESLAEAGTTRIHLVDLEGAFGGEKQDAFGAFPSRYPGIRFQLGGGLRSRDRIQAVLDQGFESVVGTLAVEKPRELAGLPPSRVIVALDLRGRRVMTRGWVAESVCESTDVFESLLTFGFKRALVTDIDRDGTLLGPGHETAAWVASEGFDVQASGGLKELADLDALASIPGVSGAISGKALLEGRLDLADAAVRAALMGGR